MRRASSVFTLLVVTAALSTGSSFAQEAPEIEALEAEISTLKEEVAKLRKELDEVLALSPIQSLLVANRPIDVTMSVEGAPSMGSDDAALTLIEFSDFQCPYCARHAKQTVPSLKDQYVETGIVKYVFLDFPLRNHPMAPKAAEAAHCALEQDRFWEMHDVLFENQAVLQQEMLPEHASTAGVDDAAAFQECLDSGRYAELVESNTAEGSKIGVRGTPSFGLGYTLDGGKSVRVLKVIRGAQPMAQFEESIEELLEADRPEEGSN